MSPENTHIYDFIFRHFQGSIGAIQLASPLLLIFITLELIKPGKKLNWKSTTFNIIYTPLFLMISSMAMEMIWKTTPTDWTKGFIHIQEKDSMMRIGLFVLYLATFDFLYYWLHRAQHTIPWLWLYHATHHSDPNVSVLSTSRHHWLEDVFRFIPILLPLAIIFGSLNKLPLWMLAFPGLYGTFIHWNTPWRMNAISKIIGTPWFHRIHHSQEEIHHNKNYAIFFPIWDVIFGSAHFPKPNEFPETGINTKINPNSLKRLLPVPKQ